MDKLAEYPSLRLRWRRLVSRFRQWIARERWRINGMLWIGLFLSVGMPNVGSSLGWLAVNDCYLGSGCSRTKWLLIIIGGIALLVVFYLAVKAVAFVAQTVVWSRLHTVVEGELRCRVLIMGLSEERMPLHPNTIQSVTDLFSRHGWPTSPSYPEFVVEKIKSIFAKKPDLYGEPIDNYLKQNTNCYLNQHGVGDAATLQALATRWQQNVRAALLHGDSLEMIYVLPSEESAAQFELFKSFMAALFPRILVDFVRADDGMPFRLAKKSAVRSYENHAYVWEGLSQAVSRAHERAADKKQWLADDEICIDVTAGQKTFSIAGANVTLNRELRLSYVSTSSGVVTAYRAEADTADTMRRIFNAGGAGLGT